jgi:hypothetical protein
MSVTGFLKGSGGAHVDQTRSPDVVGDTLECELERVA